MTLPARHPLHQALKQAGLKQVYTALELGIRPATLAAYLLGYRPMPSDVQHRIQEIVLLARRGVNHA